MPSSVSSRRILHNYPRAREVRVFLRKVRRLKPVLIILFGSVARGNFKEDSDADVLILFERPLRWAQVYSLGMGVVQPVVKTMDEFSALLEEGEPFAFEILEDGVLLYDADGYHARFTKQAAAARDRHCLVRVKGSWRWTVGQVQSWPCQLYAPDP